ncbi:MAG: hypothetical protein WD250_05020 [Egibacteraceae bacterium]
MHSFAGAPLHPAQAGLALPQERYRRWHEREVFRGPARELTVLAAETARPYG